MSKAYVHSFGPPPDLIYDRNTRSYRLMPSGREVPSAAGILEAAGFGTAEEHQTDIAVREACAQVDLGQIAIGEVKPSLRAYVEAWLSFCKAFRARWAHVETHVLNTELGYACTPSRLGHLFGSLGGAEGSSAAVEIVTDKTSCNCTTGPRLAAYQLACAAYFQAFTPELRILVQLNSSGRYGFTALLDSCDEEFFLGALKKSKAPRGWRQKLRRWFGRPMPKQMQAGV